MPTIPVAGPKTMGTAIGATAAVAYAGDATTVTMHAIGFTVAPDAFEAACANLVQGGWIGALGAAGLLGGLIGGYLLRKAQARWGAEGNTPTV